ncbi:PilT/PilU family type 4a pilus ATPase [Candidatus Poribacteria bacterium]|nr:PilT/PilU family type 4a pilus ATPase [Candidatus Poribacteria bacterium]
MEIQTLLQITVARKASDLIIVNDALPTLRVGGELVTIEGEKLTEAETKRLVYALLNAEQIEKFEREWELDFSTTVPNLGRFRVNVHYQKNNVAAAIRYLSMDIPRFEALRLPESARELALKRRGLVLITGPSGSGKSTTLAALIDIINSERACHIITIEDPIEYVHTNKLSIVEQREVYTDTHSFVEALKRVLRQSPDVILIGEMRDADTIKTAITAAETGHLILATLHTIDACQTIDRIIDIFHAEQQQQVRAQLSMCLQGIIAQTLLPRSGGTGQILAAEVMMMTDAIGAAIRSGKNAQIYSYIQTGRIYGMQTLDYALKELYTSGLIDYKAAAPYVRDVVYFRG